MLWGFPAALSLTVSVAKRLPAAAGLNVTLMVQAAPAATVEPQLFCWLKSPALGPPNPMLLIVRNAAPLLVSVTAEASLLWPTISPPKLRLAGARVTAGTVPVPVREII